MSSFARDDENPERQHQDERRDSRIEQAAEFIGLAGECRRDLSVFGRGWIHREWGTLSRAGAAPDGNWHTDTTPLRIRVLFAGDPHRVETLTPGAAVCFADRSSCFSRSKRSGRHLPRRTTVGHYRVGESVTANTWFEAKVLLVGSVCTAVE